MTTFECKKCGRCCRELRLEIMEIDLIREPRLAMVAIPTDDKEYENPFEKSYILPNPCPFQDRNKCAIYDTRPNICVAYTDKCLIRKT
ncbi:MAG: YkgJ family cysteine cluster protein [Planctomycetes bacterium]|nr:YkgJ family cysteine cluster protein [Planctomycetota bacterium]